MELITRQEARKQGKKHYFTGKPCKLGHVALRTVSCRQCLDCTKKYAEEYRKRNTRDTVTYFKETPCKYGHVGLWYSKTNSCKTCKDIRDKKYRELNKEVIKETLRKFKKRNPHKVNADTAKRRAAKKKATPKWLTREMSKSIIELYKESIVKRKMTGINYHVDHIVPLTSDVVCGLHVPWNLQILTEQKNLSKSNKLLEFK